MANQLKMAQTHTIARLWKQGWARRRIARELELDRESRRKGRPGTVGFSPIGSTVIRPASKARGIRRSWRSAPFVVRRELQPREVGPQGAEAGFAIARECIAAV